MRAASLQSVGTAILRYGLVIVLLLIGLAKFTPEDAAAIQGLVQHSPFMAWMYFVWSVSGVSRVIGTIEIVTAIFIALRPIAPRMSFAGSLAATVTFLLTTSFLFSTPGAFQHSLGFLGAAGQFLIKDLVLLGASVYLAAEALRGGVQHRAA